MNYIYPFFNRFFLIMFFIAITYCEQSMAENNNTSYNDPITINVDLNKKLGPLDKIWSFWGYDEPNYTYMKDGLKLLSELSDLSPVPVYVRVHSLLVTGDGTASLKWGSTNVYTEDKKGNPIYNWDIIDRIFDSFIERGMKPIAQIGFMPEALSTNPDPYKHFWKPGAKYNDIYTGWSYPPNNYKKWADLIYNWVLHSVKRYGKEEVESWYWEVWNEPNIGYWRGTAEEYHKLYDYSADAVKRALPTAMIGGPESTGPAGEKAEAFLRNFLDHVVSGKNYATGKKGSPLDFITFHAKGDPKVINGVVQMNISRQLRDVSKGFEVIASYPTIKHLPIIIGECDPEGCAACSEADYPSNAYRNGTMYSSYTAASYARIYELAEFWGVNLKGAVTWGFEFEDQQWFAGFRDMSTNGVDKPVLNVFRMFGLMKDDKVEVRQDNLAYNFIKVRDNGVKDSFPDINAIASSGGNSATIIVWNYHDINDINVPDSPVRLNISQIPSDKVLLTHYRIDQNHSNSYTLWKEMGSPQKPSIEQINKLEKAGQLQLLNSPKWIDTKNGKQEVCFNLPRQGVSFIEITW